MAQLETLFAKYDRLVIFDTETTGLQFSRDEIIEFAAAVVERRDGKVQVIEEYDELIRLSPCGFVPPMIEKLTVEMKDAARRLDFELAAYLRDKIRALREDGEK